MHHLWLSTPFLSKKKQKTKKLNVKAFLLSLFHITTVILDSSRIIIKYGDWFRIPCGGVNTAGSVNHLLYPGLYLKKGNEMHHPSQSEWFWFVFAKNSKQGTVQILFSQDPDIYVMDQLCPAGTSVILVFFEEIRKFWRACYNGGLWENIFSIINKQPIHSIQLYFIRRTSKWHLNCLSILRYGSDIYRFPAWHVVKTPSLLENLEILEPSLRILKKFKCHWNVL